MQIPALAHSLFFMLMAGRSTGSPIAAVYFASKTFDSRVRLTLMWHGEIGHAGDRRQLHRDRRRRPGLVRDVRVAVGKPPELDGSIVAETRALEHEIAADVNLPLALKICGAIVPAAHCCALLGWSNDVSVSLWLASIGEISMSVSPTDGSSGRSGRVLVGHGPRCGKGLRNELIVCRPRTDDGFDSVPREVNLRRQPRRGRERDHESARAENEDRRAPGCGTSS